MTNPLEILIQPQFKTQFLSKKLVKICQTVAKFELNSTKKSILKIETLGCNDFDTVCYA